MIAMNTPPTISALLDDEQLDRLEILLDTPELEDAMRLDEIQGYLCAALAGPQPINEEDRLVDILGNEDALNSDTGREAAGLIHQFAEALATDLAAGNAPVLLLYPKDDDADGPSDYLPWCQAYLAGVDQAEPVVAAGRQGVVGGCQHVRGVRLNHNGMN